MKLPNNNPLKLKSWKTLMRHFDEIKMTSIETHFTNDPDRAKRMSLKWEDFFIDYSKNRLNSKTILLMCEFAKEAGLEKAINAYFEGEKINQTENRAVLHTALRNFSMDSLLIDNKNIIPEIHAVRKKMKLFSNKIISGEWKGFTGKSITHIVNVGIGGSDLGPLMVTEALEFYKNHLTTFFISNVDGDHVNEVLKKCPIETTLFLIVSKSFNTQETITNAKTIKKWFLSNSSEVSLSKHFIAISSNTQKIKEYGLTKENVFLMKNWTGGRFSLWSSAGLSICLSIGYENFEKLLKGAEAMDIHFKKTPFEKNMPLILSFIGVWYNNFYNAETEVIIPYTQYLRSFPNYLQQASMESNGKSVDRNGENVTYQTGTIIWGSTGTNAQHAFFQLIHQGTRLIPADFIGFKNSLYKEKEHQDQLIANFFAQTEALMKGKKKSEVIRELELANYSSKSIDRLLPFKIFKGNCPTNSILIKELTPYNLGALISLYESKIFTQGILWNIFSYDQWGVELGKELANKILITINSRSNNIQNKSTEQLINLYRF
ncbi:MAG: glucose-6-phosphate isomerase [Flavobacteriaceae bacterium]|nr:glucose-6-phosphate isomerase [Flavobacteriaceae bacterium]